MFHHIFGQFHKWNYWCGTANPIQELPATKWVQFLNPWDQELFKEVQLELGRTSRSLANQPFHLGNLAYWFRLLRFLLRTLTLGLTWLVGTCIQISLACRLRKSMVCLSPSWWTLLSKFINMSLKLIVSFSFSLLVGAPTIVAAFLCVFWRPVRIHEWRMKEIQEND